LLTNFTQFKWSHWFVTKQSFGMLNVEFK